MAQGLLPVYSSKKYDSLYCWPMFFFFQAEDGIRDSSVTGVQTCALPISPPRFCPRVFQIAAQKLRQNLGGVDTLAVGLGEIGWPVIIDHAGNAAGLLRIRPDRKSVV